MNVTEMKKLSSNKGLRLVVNATRGKLELVIYSYWTPKRVTNWVNHHLPLKRITKALFAHNAQWGFSTEQIIEFTKALRNIEEQCDCWKFGKTYYISQKR